MKKLFTVLLTGLLLLVYGCTSTSKIIGSWKSPDLESDKYENIFVYALINNNFIMKQTIEDDIDQIMEKKEYMQLVN